MSGRTMQSSKRRRLLLCAAALVLLCLVLFFLLRGTGRDADSRAGSYSLAELRLGDTDETALSNRDLSLYSLSLREDGTGQLVLETGYLDLTWDEENFYDPSGEPLPYRYEDGVLRFAVGDYSLVFQKQAGPDKNF